MRTIFDCALAGVALFGVLVGALMLLAVWFVILSPIFNGI